MNSELQFPFQDMTGRSMHKLITEILFEAMCDLGANTFSANWTLFYLSNCIALPYSDLFCAALFISSHSLTTVNEDVFWGGGLQRYRRIHYDGQFRDLIHFINYTSYLASNAVR
jgi:hypothetical protein